MNTRLVSLFVLCCFSSSVFAQDELSVDKAHMAGVCKAHQGSIESWLTGDVLIKFTLTGTGRRRFVPPGPDSATLVSETSGYVRFIFDFEQKRFVVVNRKKSTTELFDGLENQVGEPVRSADDSAGIYDMVNGVSSAKSIDGTIQDLRRITADENNFLSAVQVPQFMGLGCTPYGATAWQPLKEVFDSCNRYGHVDAITSVENVGKDRYRVGSSIENKSSQAGGSRGETEWDVKRQVPLRFAYYAGPKADPEKKFSLKPIHSCTAEWQEINGYLVPVLGRGSYQQPMSYNNQSFGMSYEFELQLHWFSINEEIPDETFAEAVLKDAKKLAELIDDKWFDKNESEID